MVNLLLRLQQFKKNIIEMDGKTKKKMRESGIIIWRLFIIVFIYVLSLWFGTDRSFEDGCVRTKCKRKKFDYGVDLKCATFSMFLNEKLLLLGIYKSYLALSEWMDT